MPVYASWRADHKSRHKQRIGTIRRKEARAVLTAIETGAQLIIAWRKDRGQVKLIFTTEKRFSRVIPVSRVAPEQGIGQGRPVALRDDLPCIIQR